MVQYKVLVGDCCLLHNDLYTESNLGVMKE